MRILNGVKLYSVEDLKKDLIKTPEDERIYNEGLEAMRKEIRAELLAEAGLRIRRIRQGKKITQDDLAKRVGTAKSNISRLENGDQNVTIGYLSKVANALGKSLSIRIV